MDLLHPRSRTGGRPSARGARLQKVSAGGTDWARYGQMTWTGHIRIYQADDV
jgi:hypothetical protein